MKTNKEAPTSSYSNYETLVLQIIPEIECGQIQINGQFAQKICANIFIPNSNNSISCPLNYFQENASLPDKWINNDSGEKLILENIDNLIKVTVTIKLSGKEEKIDLPDSIDTGLLDYFNQDICHNSNAFKGFDCYAFVSLLANVKYFPKDPDFEYIDVEPKVGNITVITSDRKLPEFIKHWALYLGDELCLSKFGKSGEGSQSLVEIVDLNGMMTLYNCQHIYIARPKTNAKPWDGYPR